MAFVVFDELVIVDGANEASLLLVGFVGCLSVGCTNPWCVNQLLYQSPICIPLNTIEAVLEL